MNLISLCGTGKCLNINQKERCFQKSISTLTSALNQKIATFCVHALPPLGIVYKQITVFTEVLLLIKPNSVKLVFIIKLFPA